MDRGSGKRQGAGPAALLHRLADALMVTPEERAMLFQLAMPDLKLWTFAAAALPLQSAREV